MKRSPDYTRFREIVSTASRLVITGGYSSFDPANSEDNDILAATDSAETIVALLDALTFHHGGRMDWMTLGQPTLVFLRDDQVLAAVGCIGPDYLRCEELWDGDVKLLDDSHLHWLIMSFAASSVEAAVEAGVPLGEVAQKVRRGYEFSPMSTYKALRKAGQPHLESKTAADTTLTSSERRLTETARDTIEAEFSQDEW